YCCRVLVVSEGCSWTERTRESKWFTLRRRAASETMESSQTTAGYRHSGSIRKTSVPELVISVVREMVLGSAQHSRPPSKPKNRRGHAEPDRQRGPLSERDARQHPADHEQRQH